MLEALDKVTADLGNPALSPQDRAIAICWILHLIGDMHQPLHAASLVSGQYPNGDQGGILAMVMRTPNDHSMTGLHMVWDSMLGTEHSPELNLRKADALRHDARWTREKLAAQARLHDFATWARESHELAITDVYRNGQLQTLNVELWIADHSVAIPPLPADYLGHGEEVVTRRVMLAAYRIADLLNEALGKKDMQLP